MTTRAIPIHAPDQRVAQGYPSAVKSATQQGCSLIGEDREEVEAGAKGEGRDRATTVGLTGRRD
jgi:hypothetical protein